MTTKELHLLNDIEKQLWNSVDKLRLAIDSKEYKHVREKEKNAHEGKLKISSVRNLVDQTYEQDTQAILKSWFVDFEPTRAKIAAKKRWLAINDIIETSSPACYSVEFDAYNIKQNTLNEAMTLATIAFLVDQKIEELELQSTETLAQLNAIADLFPDEFDKSELGEIPAGWSNQTVEGLIELLIKSMSK
tara:strand:- start:917 stop:1486 length:570 start_codon:yes stop_codon:yes gene_type:complete